MLTCHCDTFWSIVSQLFPSFCLFGPKIFVWSSDNYDMFWGFSEQMFHTWYNSVALQTGRTKMRDFGARLHWHTLPSAQTCKAALLVFSLSSQLLPRWAAWAQCQFVPSPPTFTCFKCDWPSAEAQMGLAGSSWAVHVSERATKWSSACWRNLFVGFRSTDRL